MARRGRIGSLSESTYFPGTGDQLEDHQLGIVWECAKSNKFKDVLTGRTVKYGLLLGRSPDITDFAVKAISSEHSDFLDGIETIRRKLPEEGLFRVYDWNNDSETWQQRVEDY